MTHQTHHTFSPTRPAARTQCLHLWFERRHSIFLLRSQQSVDSLQTSYLAPNTGAVANHTSSRSSTQQQRYRAHNHRGTFPPNHRVPQEWRWWPIPRGCHRSLRDKRPAYTSINRAAACGYHSPALLQQYTRTHPPFPSSGVLHVTPHFTRSVTPPVLHVTPVVLLASLLPCQHRSDNEHVTTQTSV